MTELAQMSFLDGAVTLHHGDCFDVIRTLADCSIDAVVTDPPYGLEFMGKDWDAPWQASSKSALFGKRERATPGWGVTRNANCRTCGGRMRGAKTCSCDEPNWDEGPRETNNRQMRAFQDWCEAWASECLRVLKPGGHLVAFGGTRTYHRLACAIEDAGFEIRDRIPFFHDPNDDAQAFLSSLNDEQRAQLTKLCERAPGELSWVFGQGFPKGVPLDDHIDRDRAPATGDRLGWWDETEWERGQRSITATFWGQFNTALKPANEPICLARRPLREKTVAANILRWGTGALNIDGCRIGTERREYKGGMGRFNEAAQAQGFRPYVNGVPSQSKEIFVAEGRWPANIILEEGSPEVLAGFPETKSGTGAVKRSTSAGYQANAYGKESRAEGTPNIEYGDSGSAARYFYHAKADANDRIGSKHPTIKPVALMRWLVRLITPPGGTVLDCFAGSGTTGEAAWREGFNAILIEREAEYVADIARRMERAPSSVRERKRGRLKHGGKTETAGPLFEAAEDRAPC